jgi:hypothetical protein
VPPRLFETVVGPVTPPYVAFGSENTKYSLVTSEPGTWSSENLNDRFLPEPPQNGSLGSHFASPNFIDSSKNVTPREEHPEMPFLKTIGTGLPSTDNLNFEMSP